MRNWVDTCFILLLAAFAMPAFSQIQGKQPVELIVNVSPGGNQDQTARLMQSILLQKFQLSSVVVNKSGGSGVIANNYLNQHAHNPHYLMVIAPTLLTSHIAGVGANNFTDYTPIGLLFNEYVFITVKSSSSIQNGRDLIARLKQNPDSVSVAIASALGNHIHMGVVSPMKAAGVDISRMNIIPFRSSADSVVAVLGGQIEVVASTFSTLSTFVESGKLRILGVSSPQRLSGRLANVPTWKEMGANAVFDSWRGIVAAKGISVSEQKYWEQWVNLICQTEEWKVNIERNFRTNHFMGAPQAEAYWQAQYQDLSLIMNQLGLSKEAKKNLENKVTQ